MPFVWKRPLQVDWLLCTSVCNISKFLIQSMSAELRFILSKWLQSFFFCWYSSSFYLLNCIQSCHHMYLALNYTKKTRKTKYILYILSYFLCALISNHICLFSAEVFVFCLFIWTCAEAIFGNWFLLSCPTVS